MSLACRAMTQVQELARFVERTSYEDLSQEAVRELKVRILKALESARH
jgi:2-methylcitrate dehydratase PrpD